MKKFFSLFLLAFITTVSLQAQNVTIPDANFKSALVGNSQINTSGDADIQVSEAQAYTGDIVVNSMGITNLTGIEAFTSLTSLVCDDNSLTSLDLSANTALTNLSCYQNHLTSLTISANTALTFLQCGFNQLASLDLSANTALIDLSCAHNQLTSLDVSANTSITGLNCDNNQLTSLDLSANTSITGLNCENNQLTSLNVSANTALEYFSCDNNQLTSLDLSADPSLKELLCNTNQLVSLNLKNGHNNIIDYLDCRDNSSLFCIQVDVNYTNGYYNWFKDAGASYSTDCNPCVVTIPDANFKAYLVGRGDINTNGDAEIQCSEAAAFNGAIDVSFMQISTLTGIEAFTSLTDLNCEGLYITSLDVSANTALTTLDISGNLFTSINLSANTALTHIRCYYVPLTSLNLSLNTALTYLLCQNTQLKSLDVSANTALTYLDCSNNLLRSLDLSANTALTTFLAENNRLVSLNLKNGNNGILSPMFCRQNPSLTCIQVDDVNAAHSRWYKDAGASYNTVCIPCIVNIPDGDFKSYLVGRGDINSNGDAEIQCYEAQDFNGAIDVSFRQISTLTGIEAFTSLTDLNCDGLYLTSLDLSANTALTTLKIAGNQFTTIDLSANTALTDLRCYSTPLTSLNLSSNTALTYLLCENTNLTSLDVSANTALTYLDCANNLLRSLDLSANTALTTFSGANNHLVSLNLKNGNNGILSTLYCFQNPSLTCIQVDDVSDPHYGWYKDASASYNTNCSVCVVTIPDANFKAALVGNSAINTNGNGEIECSEAAAYTGAIQVAFQQIYNLTGIEAFTSITSLDCGFNHLTSLNVSANTALTHLSCFSNQLTSLNVSTNTALTYLVCSVNPLTSLDVSTNTALTYLDCNGNQLTSLNVLANTALTYVSCSNNQLTSLNLSANTSLTTLYCNLNRLTRLNLRNILHLQSLDCTSNPSLSCIQVDNVSYASTQSGWSKDAAASYSTHCGAACTAITSTVVITNRGCYGSATASFTVTPTNGEAAYRYKFGKSGTYGSSGTFSNLKAGSYKVYILDGNGCTGLTTVVISQPAKITGTFTKTDVSGCRGGSNGSLTVMPTTGRAPYMYKLNSTGTYGSANTFSGLKAATYKVYVQDSAGCEGTISVTVSQPSAVSASFTTINASCIGAMDGSMTVQGINGTSSYTYRLGTRGAYSSNNTFTGLSAKAYKLYVQDAIGCAGNITISVGEQPVSCNRQPSMARGGTPTVEASHSAFEVVLSPNPTKDVFTLITHSASNLPVQVKVIDVNGKTIYQTKGLAEQAFRFGETFMGGVYLIQVTQGDEVRNVKAMKIR